MIAVDQEVRDRALDISASFAVSAPAGSGKTGLLVRRILRLLATCDHPEQVLAITFTRKAAAEMRERILAALDGARLDTPPGDEYQRAIWQDARQVLERDRERGWQLVASPARLRIMTIDSLCRHIARQMAIETALGELPEPTEQPGLFYREAIRGFFAHLEQSGSTGDDLAILLENLDNNLATLEELLESLLARREQWLGPLLSSREANRPYLEQVLKNTVAETLAALRGSLLVVEGELMMLADYAAANLKAAGVDNPVCALAGLSALPDVAPNSENLDAWLAVSDLLLTSSDGWRQPKGLTKKNGFPTAKDSVDGGNAALRKEQMGEVLARLQAQPGLLQLLTDLRNLPGLSYPDSQWRLLGALTRILPQLVAELSVLFKSRHSCDFTEVTLAALSALGSDEEITDVSLKLDYRIHHILVDEFQDTASLQFELLKGLIRGWQAGDGRTLFVVGDGMQSLYGFRNANVGLFLEARRQPVGDIRLEPLDLAVNFRSDQSIVTWVNHCFQGIFPQREDISRGAVRYARAVAARRDLPHCGVSVETFPPEADGRDEARRVLELIRQARQQDPEGSIAVLVRARSHLGHIIPALQEEGIGWEATDIDPLASRMPVLDLHSLTRALLDPADRVAWLAVLRAPWCGLELGDLHALATAGAVADGAPDHLPWLGGQLFSSEAIATLGADGRQRLERVVPILRAAWQQRYRKPLRQWVEGTWLALGGPATLLASHELGWCRQYLDLLEQYERGGAIQDMAQFAAALDRLFASPPRSQGNPVRVMTIHKSKGLEFDTVILPALHRSGAANGSELLYWRERLNEAGEPELIISPLLSPAEQGSGADNRLVAHLKYEAKQKASLEDARVLYVACTRAIKRLHLLYREPARAPAAGSLLSCLWPALEASAEAGATHTAHQAAASAGEAGVVAPTLISRLPGHWQHPFCQVSTVTPSTAAVAVSPDSQSSDAPLVGTVLHRTLARIVADGPRHWRAGRIERQRDVWAIQLRQLGARDVDTALATLDRALAAMLADSTGLWLLRGDHEHSACELAIGHGSGDGARVAVIDRTFVDDGSRWIVDYKTSEPYPGEPLEAFVARESTLYREQLRRYREVLSLREPGRTITTALYFPLLPHLAIVE